jgi:hypothetical protein
VRAALVRRFAVRHRAHDRELVRDLCGVFQQFVENDAIEFGRHGSEWAAIFDGRERLWIEAFLRGDSTRQKDVDDRIRRRFLRLLRGASAEKITERKPESTDQSHVKKIAAGNTTGTAKVRRVIGPRHGSRLVGVHGNAVLKPRRASEVA